MTTAKTFIWTDGDNRSDCCDAYDPIRTGFASGSPKKNRSPFSIFNFYNTYSDYLLQQSSISDIYCTPCLEILPLARASKE